MSALTIEALSSTLNEAEESWGKTFKGTIPWVHADGKQGTINLTDLCYDIAEIVRNKSPIYVLALAVLLQHKFSIRNLNISVGLYSLGLAFGESTLMQAGQKLCAQIKGNRYADKFCHCWHTLMAPQPEKRAYLVEDVLRAALGSVARLSQFRENPAWPATKAIYDEFVPAQMSEETFQRAILYWAATRPTPEILSGIGAIIYLQTHMPDKLSPLAGKYLAALKAAHSKPATIKVEIPKPVARPTKAQPQPAKSANSRSNPNSERERWNALFEARGKNPKLRGGL